MRLNLLGRGLTGFEAVTFGDGANSLTLLASQIGPGLARDAVITGGATADASTLTILMGDSLTLDLSRLTFTDWTATDQIVLRGDAMARRSQVPPRPTRCWAAWRRHTERPRRR